MDKWVQLYVKAPEGNGYTTPEAMKRVDQHVNRLGAMFCAPEGTPIQRDDGTWEVRVMSESFSTLVEDVLKKHYGLEIVNKVVNDQSDE